MQNWKQKLNSFTHKKTHEEPTSPNERSQKPLDTDLSKNINSIRNVFGEDADLIVRNFRVYGLYDAAILLFSSLVDQDQVRDHVLKSLMNIPSDPSVIPEQSEHLPEFIWNRSIQVARGDRTPDLNTLPAVLIHVI